MIVLSKRLLADLTCKADLSPRLRQSLNIHSNHQEPCQRLLNSINIGSYIQPHRHSSDPKTEMLIAVKGKFALVEIFDDGEFKQFTVFSSERFSQADDSIFGVEITPDIWHTVIALEVGSVLLEIKEGPFNSEIAKEPAIWAPEPQSVGVSEYLLSLYSFCGFGSLLEGNRY